MCVGGWVGRCVCVWVGVGVGVSWGDQHMAVENRRLGATMAAALARIAVARAYVEGKAGSLFEADGVGAGGRPQLVCHEHIRLDSHQAAAVVRDRG